MDPMRQKSPFHIRPTSSALLVIGLIILILLLQGFLFAEPSSPNLNRAIPHGLPSSKPTPDPPSSVYGWIEVRVRSIVDFSPVDGVTVEVLRRGERLPDGSVRFRSWPDEVFEEVLSPVLTGMDGIALIQVPLRIIPEEGGDVFSLKLRGPPGYQESYSVGMVGVSDRDTTRIELYLEPRVPGVDGPPVQLKQLIDDNWKRVLEADPNVRQPRPWEQLQKDSNSSPQGKSSTSDALNAGSGLNSPPVPDIIPVVNCPECGGGTRSSIPLDDFVAGVVAREMPGFAYQALKAQAVAARTFALRRLASGLSANGGVAYNPCVNLESSPEANAAFNTSKAVLLYGNDFIWAQFAARCPGDYTIESENGRYATCASANSSDDLCPTSAGFADYTYLRSVECSHHASCESNSCEASCGNCGEAGTSSESQCCAVIVDGVTKHIYGHGVGFCQQGAGKFAKELCWSWDQIASRFYPGTSIANFIDFAFGNQVLTIANLYARPNPCDASSPTLIPKGTAGSVIGGPNSCVFQETCRKWWKISYANGVVGWSAEDYLKRTGSGCQTYSKTYSTGLHLMSLPEEAANCGSCSPSDVITDDAPNGGIWRFDCTQGWVTPSCIQGAGNGYALWLPSTATIDVNGTPASGGPVPVDLCDLISLVGCPFVTGVNWSQTQVEVLGEKQPIAVAAASPRKWVYNLLVGFDGFLPSLPSTIQAGSSCLFMSRVPGVRLWLYPNPTQAIASAPEAPIAVSPASVQSDPSSWQFRFVAESYPMSDNLTHLGVSPGATDGCDDLLEEPDIDVACGINPDGCIRVYFTSDCTDFSERNRDLRAPFSAAETKTWTAWLKSKFPSSVSPVTVTWPDISQVPAGYTVTLNPGTQNIDMRTQASYQYTPSSLEETRVFTIQVTDQSCSPPGQPGFTGADSLCGPESDIFIFHAYSNDATSWNWTSSCGGTFSDPSSEITHWTAPAGLTGLCQFTVTASNSCGTSEPAFHNVLVKQAPSAVAIGQVAGVCSTGVTFSATAANNPTSWTWRSACGGTFNPPTAAQTVWTAPNGFVGPCQITAVASNYCGTDSSTISVDCGCQLGPPATPSAPSCTPGCDFVDLVWNSVPTATSYQVWQAGRWAVVTDTFFRDTSPDSSRYTYRISAMNLCGESQVSDAVTCLFTGHCVTQCGDWFVDTTISIAGPGGNASELAIAGDRLFVTRAQHRLTVHHIPDLAQVGEIDLSQIYPTSYPLGITSDASKVYVNLTSIPSFDRMIAIDPLTLQITDSALIKPYANEPAVSNGRVYIGSSADSIRAFDASTLAWQSSIKIQGQAYMLAFDPDFLGGYASVRDYPSQNWYIAVLNPARDGIASTIPLPLTPSGLTFESHQLFATLDANAAGFVAAIDPAGNVVTHYTPVGPHPWFISSLDGFTFCVNSLRNDLKYTVTVVDANSHLAVRTLVVGKEPRGIVADTASRRVFVANTSGQSISIIRRRHIPSQVSLQVPVDGDTDQIQPVMMRWHHADQAEGYRIELDDAMDFATPLLQASVADTSSAVSDLPSSTVLYWRVAASNMCGDGSWSEVASFTTAPCACDCDADPQCDSVTNIFDVVRCINVAFRDGAPLADPDPFCPRVTTDVDCSGATDILDVVHLIDVAFRDGDPATEFCQACPEGVGVGTAPSSTRSRSER